MKLFFYIKKKDADARQTKILPHCSYNTIACYNSMFLKSLFALADKHIHKYSQSPMVLQVLWFRVLLCYVNQFLPPSF